MIVLDLEQGSPEWIAARLGIPTASQFHRILTPKTMKLAAGSHTYLCELVAERLMNASLDPYVSELMERGSELEAQAIDYYALQKGVDVTRVGHILRDDHRAGCSPDGLVGEDGGLEIKCPTAPVHVSYMLNAPMKYRAQVQGALWITGRRWWDFVSFNPELPPVLVRFYRDEDYIAALQEAVLEFCGFVEDALDRLRVKED